MQNSFSDFEYSQARERRQTCRDRFLAEIETCTPWADLVAVLEPFYPKSGQRSRPPVGLEPMLRMFIAQNCFGLSDEGMEDAIYDSHAIRQHLAGKGLMMREGTIVDATLIATTLRPRTATNNAIPRCIKPRKAISGTSA